jgi:hypothetical protein
MSDRQLARAATSGRSLTFHLNDKSHLTGYLVGSDDFHWLVAHDSWSNDYFEGRLTLVHKGSATMISIAPTPTLADEGDSYQEFVNRIGGGFWAYCNKTYLGQTGPTTPTPAPELEPVP